MVMRSLPMLAVLLAASCFWVGAKDWEDEDGADRDASDEGDADAEGIRYAGASG